MRRLLLAAALTLSVAAPASADLQSWCWDNVPGFRTSALVCSKVPGGIG